jgi:hypothetical protein
MRPVLQVAITTAIEAYVRDEDTTASDKGRQRPETSQWRLFGRGETISGRVRWQASRIRK